MTTIAFYGVGQMGNPMVGNLVKAGHRVRVYDLVPALMEQAVQRGAEAATSAKNALREAQVVISMLPTIEAVEDLYLGRGDLLSHITPAMLVLECSTISPQEARRVHDAAAKRNIRMIDAPVSGGVAGATAGTLTFICGGEAPVVELARPILSVMGKNIFHAGPSGAGQMAKICNNMLLAIHMIGTCEALQLGVDNGLDPKVLSEIMLKSSGRNWSLELYNPYPGVMENVPASRNYEGGFKTRLMNKDLILAMGAAQASGSTTPLGALARNLYAMHGRHGTDELDFSSIQQLFARK